MAMFLNHQIGKALEGRSTFPGLETQTQEDESLTSWGHVNF